jgi:hypothetical protein
MIRCSWCGERVTNQCEEDSACNNTPMHDCLYNKSTCRDHANEDTFLADIYRVGA